MIVFNLLNELYDILKILKIIKKQNRYLKDFKFLLKKNL